MAREAGLTTGAIYSNFRDKAELFMAAFDHAQRTLPGRLGEEEEADAEGLIRGYARSAALLESSTELQILNFEMALLGIRDVTVREIVRGATAEQIESAARALSGSAEERRELATLMLALANGLSLLRMFAPEAVPAEMTERGLGRLLRGGRA